MSGIPPWPASSHRSLATFDDCPLFARALQGPSGERPSLTRRLCFLTACFPMEKQKLEACDGDGCSAAGRWP